MRALRVLFQLFFLLSSVYLGIGFARGWTGSSVERYCPFGGLATSYSLLSTGHLSCATGIFNVSLLLALVVLTFVARKAFCSWVCPIGTLSEWLSGAGGELRNKLSKVLRRRRAGDRGDGSSKRRGDSRKRAARGFGVFAPPQPIDRPLRWLRLPILALVLGFSFYTAELVFRPFCPYYISFSMNGHDVRMWSYGILAVLVALVVVIPMVWCRYLCPLGGALWPLSAMGRLRLRRDPGSCTSCRACDRACPHSLPISDCDEVRSGECTLCLECARACPVEQPTLTLHASRSSKRSLHQSVVPLLLVSMIAAGVLAGNLVAIPSYSQTYAESPELADESRRQVTLEVDGVRCVDTARRAAAQLDGVAGVLHLTAYASERELVVEYDGDTVAVDRLVQAIEGPVYDPEQNKFFFHIFTVVAIDGRNR